MSSPDQVALTEGDRSTVGGTTFVPLTFEVTSPIDEVRTSTTPACVMSSKAARVPAQLVLDGRWPADVAITGGAASVYEVRAASVRGVGHRGASQCRQDALAMCYHADADAVVFAAADGVSQSRRSDLGAQIVATQAVESACRILQCSPMAEPAAFAERFGALARRTLQLSRAFEFDLLEDDIAATLVLAVVGRESVRAVLVGDAALWRLDATGTWTSLFGARETTVRDNATCAMPMHPDQVVFATFGLEPGDVVIGVTDGLDDPLATGTSPAASFLAQRWATPPDQIQFAIDLSFEAATYDDDRTAVAVWRR